VTKNSRRIQVGSRKQLGRWGESIAENHLKELGYQFIDRNWRCSQGEIDLVMKAGETIVFVEVKTRRGRQMGTPEEGLTWRKSQKLLDLGQLYIADHNLDVDWRIDLVAVELDKTGKLLRCDHIPNAVLGW